MLHCVIILNKWKIIVIWLTWNCLNEKLCETLTLISFKQVSCILKYKTWQKILAIFKYKPDETWPTFFLNTKKWQPWARGGSTPTRPSHGILGDVVLSCPGARPPLASAPAPARESWEPAGGKELPSCSLRSSEEALKRCVPRFTHLSNGRQSYTREMKGYQKLALK